MWKGYTFEEYKELIHILYEEHKIYTGRWLSNISRTPYNLKKTLVKDVCSQDLNDIDGFISEDFRDYVASYKSNLGQLYANIVLSLTQHENEYNNVKGRIKNDDSILLKLHRKMHDDDGSFPLNKYLNDLLGFRIIDKNYKENISLLPEYINELKEQKMRFMHKIRENGEYKGYHIYFMGSDAKFFPMELQIWDADNERQNMESHQIYKKDYTYWPKIYKGG